MQLKLWPIMGINLYDIFNDSMVAQLKHSENDDTYPAEVYQALAKQRNPIREADRPDCETTGFSNPSSHSDTPSTSNVIPIFNR